MTSRLQNSIGKAYIIWALIALFQVFQFFLSRPHGDLSFIKLDGDAFDYLEGCENLATKGKYFIINFHNNVDYTYRMPGMAIFYYPIRLLFSLEDSLNIFSLFQLILSIISTYLLYGIFLFLTRSSKWSIAFVLLYLLSTYVDQYNHSFLTESLATSLLIIAIYFVTTVERRSKKYLFFAGLCFGCAFFLRPFILPLLVPACLYLITVSKTSAEWRKSIICLLVPLFIMESMWIGRNYITTQKFIPFMSYDLDIYNYSKAEEAASNFIKSFGFQWAWWVRDSQHAFFLTDEQAKGFGFSKPGLEVFPRYTYNGNLTKDSLLHAQKHYLQTKDKVLSVEKKVAHDLEAARVLNRFITEYKKHRPVDFYFVSRIRLLSRFLNQPFGVYFTHLKRPLSQILSFLDSFINNTVIIIGFFGLIYFLVRFEINFWLIAGCVPLFIIGFFVGYLKVDELRFLTLSYPFLAISACYFLYSVSLWKRKRLALFTYALFFILIFYRAYHTTLTYINWEQL